VGDRARPEMQKDSRQEILGGPLGKKWKKVGTLSHCYRDRYPLGKRPLGRDYYSRKKNRRETTRVIAPGLWH